VIAPRRPLPRLARRGLLHLSLLVVSLLWLVPSLGLLVTSLRPRPDIASSGFWTALVSPALTLQNYREVLGAQGMVNGFVNSLLITVPSTLLPVLIAAPAAYAFAWLRFPGRDGLFLMVVALMVVPIQMTFVPVLRLLNALGLTRSFAGIWLAHTTFGLPFAIFLLRGFFALLPAELLEAARLDGASDLRILVKVVLPLSVPALASLSILQFLAVWNDLLMALVFIQSPEAMPLTVRLSQMLSTYGTEWHLLSAGAFVLMVVPLLVFFSLQRYFVQGLLAGAVK
jgi:alpha-glucoside transport system permease protein